MSQKIIILLLFVSVVIVGILFALPQRQASESNSDSTININSVNVNKASLGIECSRDVDCLAGGCSGQLCIPRDEADSVVSTCEWRDEYACYREDDCICKNSKCQWEGNEAFSECIKALR